MKQYASIGQLNMGEIKELALATTEGEVVKILHKANKRILEGL